MPLEILLKIIEEKLSWGDSKTWKTEDFENLHQLILQETDVSLSNSTLRRIWGKVEYGHLPSSTTLNTLAKFAGYENWRDFLKQQDKKNVPAAPPVEELHFKQPSKPVIPWFKIISIGILVLAISLVSIFAFKKAPKPVSTKDYIFSSRAVTRDIPNSVVFTYDAATSPSDSIFIQQSWDNRKRALVEKNIHTHTSIYYEPGFYKAKLIVDNQVVKEHELLIPTNGWMAMIDNKPVPVYLKNNEFMAGEIMQVPLAVIQKNNVPLEPKPPVIKYYNVGNFSPVAVNDFSFAADIKNEYKDGAAACQLTEILLITNGNPVIIPLSEKGCSSELNLLSVDKMVSGKKTDLSGFGVDFTQWVHLYCKSTSNSVQYFVNDKLAYECPLPAKPVNIVGLEFAFQGTGAVKNIRLESKGVEMFHSF